MSPRCDTFNETNSLDGVSAQEIYSCCAVPDGLEMHAEKAKLGDPGDWLSVQHYLNGGQGSGSNSRWRKE